MKTLGNILWYFPFFGFVTAIFVSLLGLLLTATVIAAPIGLGLIEFGKFLFWPFGNAMVSKSDLNIKQNTAWKAYSTVISIFYFPFGLFLTIATVFQIAALFVSIIGIPAALVLAKSLGTYLNPVNKKCVSSAVAAEMERRKAQGQVDKYFVKDEPVKEQPSIQEAQPLPIEESRPADIISGKEVIAENQDNFKDDNEETPSAAMDFMRKRWYIPVGGIAAIVGIYFLWGAFFSSSPEKKVERMAETYCDCMTDANDKYAKDIQSLNNQGLSPQDAYNKLQTLITEKATTQGQCYSTYNADFNILVAKANNNPQEINLLNAYSAKYFGSCTAPLQNSQAIADIETKIFAASGNLENVDPFGGEEGDEATGGEPMLDNVTDIDPKYSFLNGSYVGTLGDKSFTLTIKTNGDIIEGLNITGNNNRPVSGKILSEQTLLGSDFKSVKAINVQLSEPGDNTSDGEFKLMFRVYNDNTIKLTGDWKMYNGNLRREIKAKKQDAVVENTDNNGFSDFKTSFYSISYPSNFKYNIKTNNSNYSDVEFVDETEGLTFYIMCTKRNDIPEEQLIKGNESVVSNNTTDIIDSKYYNYLTVTAKDKSYRRSYQSVYIHGQEPYLIGRIGLKYRDENHYETVKNIYLKYKKSFNAFGVWPSFKFNAPIPFRTELGYL